MHLIYGQNTCSLATHIALVDAGAEYSLRRIDFAKTEQQSPEFLAINPKGRVPALVTSHGVLTETPAMLAYVAQRYPDAWLAPLDDPFSFGVLQSFNSYLCSTVHIAHAHRMRGNRWVDDADAIAAMQRKVPQTVGASFELIEQQMLRGPWVMGTDYTIADPYLFTLAQWLETDGVDPMRVPRVAEHRERMLQRPNVQLALAEEFADLAPSRQT